MELRSSVAMDPHESAWMAGCIALLFIAMHQGLSWFRRRALHQAGVAEAQAHKRPLAAGPRVISGRVALAGGEGDALRVEVVQDGKENQGGRNKGSRWRERARRVEARAFEVQCDDGERVRVEPDERVVLVAKLDETIRDAKTTRRRVARLRDGQQVSVAGALCRPEGAGREGAPWLMRPHRGEMSVSAEGPGAAHRARAKRAFPALVVIFGVVASPALLGYGARAVLGQDTVAHVTARRSFVTTYKQRSSTIYEVTFVTASGMTATDHVEYSDWGAVREGAEIPVREVRFSAGLTLIGHGASLTAPMMMFALVLALLAFGLSLVILRERPWYEGRLDETDREGL